MLARCERCERRLGMQVRRERDHDRVDAGRRDELGVVGERRRARNSASCRLAPLGVGVRDRDDLDPARSRQGRQVHELHDSPAPRDPDSQRAYDGAWPSVTFVVVSWPSRT
jgi:hypothetical protein